MERDDRQHRNPEQVVGGREPGQEPRPAPGKVTRTSKLPAGRDAAAQRKAAVASPGRAEAPVARSRWELTMDPWMDAAHRGVTALAERGEDMAQAAGPIQAKGLQESPEAPVRVSGQGSGAALPDEVRGQMETSFGADFSSVRIHEGPQAEALGALAYTRGADIHFAPGQYDPDSTRGRELLGHELTHVVQQAEGRVAATTQAKGVAINADTALEAEADDLGARAARGAQARTGATVTAAPAPGGSVQRYAFINQTQIQPTEPDLSSEQTAFVNDTVVRNYESRDEFQRHATGGTDYLGNLSDGTWLRFHPTGINLLGENHTLVRFDQVVPVINTRSFIYERLSNDALAPGSRLGAVYEAANAAEFQQLGIAQEPNRQRFGAESLFPKIGYAMSLALPHLARVTAIAGLKAPNYIGQPVLRAFKMGWGHSEDNLADVTARRAASQPVQPAAAALADRHTELAPLLGPFLTGLPFEGYLGDTLHAHPDKVALVPALARFAQAMLEAMTERALTDPTARLTGQQKNQFAPGGGATNTDRAQMLARWRDFNFEDSVRDATARGVRYAGMGNAHLRHLRGSLSAQQHPYDMADADLNRFRRETAELRARAT